MRPLRRSLPRRVLLLLAFVLAGVGGALAYFISTGAGTAGATVGALSAPTITAATPGAGTVSLSWSTVTAPASPAVTYYVTRAGGTVGGNCPSSAATATTSTSCTDSGLTKGTYTYTVTAVWQSWTATSASSQVTLASGAISKFVVGAPVTATAGTPFSATITAEDAQSNTVTSYTGGQTITFSGPSNAPSGTAPTYPASVTFANGVATPSPSITLYDAQTTTVTATQGSVSGTSGNITVSAGANHQIGASAASPQTAGTAFNVTLTAQDAWGNPTGTLTGTKNMTFSGPSKSPNNTAPTYPATATFTAGVATASVTLVDVQTTTITANDTTDTYNGTASNNITVSAGSASSFTVSAPTTATAGTPFPDTITALDPYGNTATGYTGSQTITFTGPANAPGGTAPTYPASVTFTNGVATPSITLYDAQTTTLTAKQGTISGTSGNITVSAGANHQIGASAASPQTAGTAFNVTLTAQDSWGNPTGTLTGTKNLTFSGPSNSPNNTAPTYPATATFTAGVATASVTLVDVQTTTITANDTTDSYNGIPSNNITVNSASTAASFTVSTPATNPTAGTAFTETITALDAYGNTDTSYTGSQTITFTGPANAPNGTAPTYPASVTFTNGVGSPSITLYDAQTTTLTAKQGTVTGTSSSFTVGSATASQISFTTQPAGATAGFAFTTQPAVTAKDTYGNVATGYAKTITLSIKSGTGTSGAVLSGCTSSLSSGITTFAGCAINVNGTAYQLNATDGTLTATSSAFNVTSATTVTKTASGTYTLTVPAGATDFNFTLHGAGGGGGGDYTGTAATGGAGGSVSGTITIPSSATSTTFTVVVGGGGGGGGGSAVHTGGAAGAGTSACAAGGAGGTAADNPATGGGGGGAATCVYLQGAPANTLVTIGGGGGGGGYGTGSGAGGAGGGGPTSNPGTNTAGSGTTAGGAIGGGGGVTLTAGAFPFTITNTAGTAGTGTGNGVVGGTCSGGTCGAGGVGGGGNYNGGGGGGGGMASGGGGGGGPILTPAAGGGGGSAYTGGTQSGSNNYTVAVSSASNGGGSAGGAGGNGGATGSAGTAGSASFTGPGLTLA